MKGQNKYLIEKQLRYMLFYVITSLCSMLPGIYMMRKISVASGKESTQTVNKIHAEYLNPRSAKTKHCKIHEE
jgi:hypothetical protein